MILVNKPQKKAQESGTPAFQELKGICMTLGMSKPPPNITMFQFFSGIEKKVSQTRGAMTQQNPYIYINELSLQEQQEVNSFVPHQFWVSCLLFDPQL